MERTPFTREGLKPGSYRVRVAKEGYESVIKTTRVVGNESTLLKVRLKEKKAEQIPLLGQLEVTTVPAGARVFLEGEFVGRTPFTREDLKPGSYRVKVTKEGYEPVIKTTRVVGSESTPLRVRLEKKPEQEKKPKQAAVSSGEGAGGRQVLSVAGVKVALRWCPPGSFMMGSPSGERDRDSDETQHRVTLTRGFWLMETEVTQELWKAVMGNNPSSFKGARRPVEEVSWHDAVEFCRKLSRLTGKEWSLPTEAEWEYACRAGTQTAYSFGDYAGKLGDYAWYNKNSRSRTHPVGQKLANAWGLFDMHGNVYEWCADWYDDYGSGAVVDPTGPADVHSFRVFRGGGWLNNAGYCRSADRIGDTPGYEYDFLGLRALCR